MKIKLPTSLLPETEVFNFWKKKNADILVLLFALSIVISYLLSPKLLFSPTTYEEGDIIRETVVIGEDLLIPDRVSTKLKQEKLLRDLGDIYDFDPGINKKTSILVQKAFETTRQSLDQIQRQSLTFENQIRSQSLDYFQNNLILADIKRSTQSYLTIKLEVEERLKELEKDPKLSPSGFERKKELDTQLRVIDRILADNAEKEIVLEQEITSTEEGFLLMEEEKVAQQLQIDERKNKAIRDFIRLLEIELKEEDFERLTFPFYTQEIENQLLALLSVINNQKIVLSKENLKWGDETHNEVRNIVSGEPVPIENLEEFSELSEVRNQLNEIAKDYFIEDETGKIRNFITLVGQKLLRPNVTENKSEYERRKEQILKEMSPVYFSVKKGEIIARAGDRATAHQVELIGGYYDVISDKENFPQMIGIVLIVMFSILLVFYSFYIRGDNNRLTFKSLLVIGISIVLTLILIKISSVLGEMLEARYEQLHSNVYKYVFPVALTSMLVGILVHFEAALLAGLLTSIFATIMLQGNLYYFYFAMMGSIVASLPMTRFESRYSLILHGLKISAINVPVIVFLYLVEKNQLVSWVWPGLGSALLSGIFTAIIVSILLPFFESIFDITTNLKLLELSNMNHPALKNLIFKAPGTYQHSILVGNLAESAASKIGANPLLARVSAYYHDIGKGVDSHFYIENQPSKARNIHDDMDPYESAKVIIDHLRKGGELADQHRLGKRIKDIMLQHHGTSLVKYFYNKAQQLATESNNPAVIEEAPFRYLGPKPQSLEAALVMLADVAEASTRSIESPTPAKISDMINRVCWAILEEGQLDESGMNLEKFRIIMDTYCKVLISIHHHRIKYPDQVNLAYLNAANFMPEKSPLS